MTIHLVAFHALDILAVPVVVPDIPIIGVDAEHAGYLPILCGVNRIVPVEGVGVVGLGTRVDLVEEGLSDPEGLLLVEGVPGWGLSESSHHAPRAPHHTSVAVLGVPHHVGAVLGGDASKNL